MHVDQESLAIDVSDVGKESVVQSASQARDCGKGHPVVPGWGQAEQATPFVHTVESGEPVCGLRALEVEELPSAFQHVEGEEAGAAGAEAHGGWREVIDVFVMPPVLLELGCGAEGW